MSIRLTNNVTIFVAELTAIKLALLWITNTSDENISQPVTIFSDSLSSLQAIKTGKTTCRPNLLVEIQELITTCKTEITFVWIPSHIGIKGNEIADKLANVATSSNCVELNIGRELSEAYALVDKYVIGKWQDMWDNCLHGRHYYEIEKHVSKHMKYIHNIRSKEVTITTLRLGKCRLNLYLHQIGKHLDGLCEACNKPETITHFLTECSGNKTCSAVLNSCQTWDIEPKIANILIQILACKM